YAHSVVGLDAREDVLREARIRTKESNIRYAQGDFRDFFVEGTFDAAICGSDSLNYVNTPGELVNVFRCVSDHLRPGGLFVFDVLDEFYLQTASHWKVIVEAGKEQFELLSFYDPVRRISEARVVFPDGIEQHRRVPIEKGD